MADMTTVADGADLDEPLLLTDDEAAAVAVGLGHTWPSSLPTVPITRDGFLAAVARGRRSLAVRDLLLPADESFGRLRGDVTDVLAGALEGGLIGGVLVTDERLEALPVEPTYYHYGQVTSARWVTDVVVAGGIHRIAPSSRAECLQLLDGLVRAVWEVGLGGEVDERRWLCVLGGGTPRRVALVGRGQLRHHVLDEIGTDGSLGHRVDGAGGVDGAEGLDGGIDAVLGWLGLA